MEELSLRLTQPIGHLLQVVRNITDRHRDFDKQNICCIRLVELAYPFGACDLYSPRFVNWIVARRVPCVSVPRQLECDFPAITRIFDRFNLVRLNSAHEDRCCTARKRIRS